MHAAEAGQTGVVFVDGAPVLPCFAEVVCLGLVVEEVGYFADQSAQGVGGHVGKEGEEGVDELRRGEGGLAIRRDVLAERVYFVGVVAEEVGGAFDNGAVSDETGSLFGGDVGCIDGGGRRYGAVVVGGVL